MCPYRYGLNIHDRRGNEIRTNCRKCISCRIAKATEIKFLTNRELYEQYKEGKGASFITLTYDEDSLPYTYKGNNEKKEPIYYYKQGKKTALKKTGILRIKNCKNEKEAAKLIENGHQTLYKEDIIKFNKRLRQYLIRHEVNKEYKAIYCGELGDRENRPHYHILLIGVTTGEATRGVRETWKHGMADIGPLVAGGISYICDYITKQTDKETKKIIMQGEGVQPPFFYHSIEMGKKWIDKHAKEIIENGFKIWTGSGKSLKEIYAPNAVIKYICRTNGLNTREVYEKMWKEIEHNTRFQRQTQTLDEYLMEQALIRDTELYNAIRSRGEQSIDTSYLAKIGKQWQFIKPRTIKVIPEKTIEKLTKKTKPNEFDVYQDLLKFFTNCKKELDKPNEIG